MQPVRILLFLCLSALLPFCYNFFAPNLHFTPQLVALLILIFIAFFYKTRQINFYLLTSVISLLVLTSGGLISPLFFFYYFLLFILAFNLHPATISAFSFFLIFILTNTIAGTTSIIQLFSLLLISPLVWLVSTQQKTIEDEIDKLSATKTDLSLWFSLKFKRLAQINLDRLEQLLSDPTLSHSQKKYLETIQQNEKYFLKNGQKLAKEITES